MIYREQGRELSAGELERVDYEQSIGGIKGSVEDLEGREFNSVKEAKRSVSRLQSLLTKHNERFARPEQSGQLFKQTIAETTVKAGHETLRFTLLLDTNRRELLLIDALVNPLESIAA